MPVLSPNRLWSRLRRFVSTWSQTPQWLRRWTHLQLVPLEERLAPAVTSNLTSGLLTIQYSATNDQATVSLSGANLQVSDGSTIVNYAKSSVTSLSIIGSPESGQKFTLDSDLRLPGSFTSTGVEEIVFSANRSISVFTTLVPNSMAITAERITLQSGATISTRNLAVGSDPVAGISLGNSGSLNWSAQKIEIQSGAKMFAHANGGFQAGDLFIKAEKTIATSYLVPLFNSKQIDVGVTVADNATLQGRNISVVSEGYAKRLSLYDLVGSPGASLIGGDTTTRPSVTIGTGLVFVPGAADGSVGPSIDRSSGSWSSDGFAKEKSIFISGTPDQLNDGTYDIASISSDGKSLILIPSNTLRSQTVGNGTKVEVTEMKTDIDPNDVPFVAVDEDGNPIAGTEQTQGQIKDNSAPPDLWAPVATLVNGLPMPLQVTLTRVYSTTTIGNGVNINASGNVTISANSTGISLSQLPSLVLGVTWSESDVQAKTKVGNSTIIAGGDVSITSTVENRFKVTTKVLGGTVARDSKGAVLQIPGPSIAVTVAQGTSVSTAETSDGTIISAGGVTIDASMTNKFFSQSSSVTSKAKSLAAGIGVTIGNFDMNAAATLRGKVDATGDVTVNSTGEIITVEGRSEATVNNEKPGPASPLFGTFFAVGSFLTGKKEKVDSKAKNEQSQEGESSSTAFQVAAGMVIVRSTQKTAASIADNAIVTVAGDLSVTAESGNSPQFSAVGSASANSKLAVGGAFVYGEPIDESRAWIGKNAIVNVDGAIEVTAAVSQAGGFPTSWGDFVGGTLGLRDTGLPWVSDGSVTSYADANKNSGEFGDALTDLIGRGQSVIDGDFSWFIQEFTTSFVSASAQPGEVKGADGKTTAKSTAASGALDFVFSKTFSKAWIDEGAKINLDTPNAKDDQSLTVSATTEVKALYVGGITGQGNPFGYTTVSSGGAVGGVYAHHDYNTQAIATIADGVMIRTKGDVTVSAENPIILGVFDFAGSSGKTFAVQGTFTVTPITSIVQAWIEDTVDLKAGGNLDVSAKADRLLITFTGAVARSDQVGVGAGLGYFDVDYTVEARIGNAVTSSTYTTPSTLIVSGNTSVTAVNDTIAVVVGIASAVAPLASPDATSVVPPVPPVPDDDPLDGESLVKLFANPDDENPTETTAKDGNTQKSEVEKVTGFGLSASLGLNLFDTITVAKIDGVTLTADGDVTVAASSDDLFIGVTGAASVNFNTQAKSSNTIAGALSWNDLDRRVEALIDQATISAAALSVTAKQRDLLVTVTAGAALTSPAQQAKTSIGVAGSANVNDVDTTVRAAITGAKSVINTTGNLLLTADRSTTVVSVAGAIGVSQRAGIGASLDLNLFDSTIEATIGNGVTVTSGGNVTVQAKNNQGFVSIGASIGVGTQKFGIAGSASWLNLGDTVTASIGNDAKVTSGGTVRVDVDNRLNVFGLGGAAGIGKDGGFGAGIAGLSMSRTVNASIGDRATIIAAGSTSASGDAGVIVRAMNSDNLDLFGAGGAVSTARAAAAGSFTMVLDNTTTNASIGSNASVTQMAGKSATHRMSVLVDAFHAQDILTVAGAAGIGKSAGIGLAVVVTPITTNTRASIGNNTVVTANRDIRVTANYEQSATIIGAALGVATSSGVGAAGSGVIQVLNHTTHATIGNSATLFTDGNILVQADSTRDVVNVAGSGALGLGGSAIGIANVTTVRTESTLAQIGDFAKVTALGNQATISVADRDNSKANVRGVAVVATASSDVVYVAAGAAGGTGKVGIAGSASVTVETITTVARVGNSAEVTPDLASQSAANAAQSLYVFADYQTDLIGVGGAAGLGSKGGVGAGADVGVVTRTTRATIGDSARVNVRGDVSARAFSGGEWLSIGASLGAGGTAGVAGAASVQTHTVRTQGRIGNNAVIFAGGNVAVTALDSIKIDGAAGQLSIGGTAGIGGSVPVVILDKETDASIGNGAKVDALANGAAFQANVTPPSVTYTDPQFFARTAVDTGSDTITLPYQHGFQTGDSVTYWANGDSAIGGLENGVTYYVIRVSATAVRLAESKEAAEAGTVIDLTSTGSGDQQSLTAFGEVAAPAVNNDDISGETFTKARTVTLGSTGVRGVIVSAVSLDKISTYGISAGGGGTVGLQIVGSVSLPEIQTTASIGDNAQINRNDAGANPGQSVVVSAMADYSRLGIGGSLAIGGTAGIAPLADVLVSEHVTKATIGTGAMVEAEMDVLVAADARQNVRSFVIGVAGGGTVALAGSVAVIQIDSQTQAIIGNSADVFAKGNVIVSANDVTDSLNVVGSAGLGLSAGGIGASVLVWNLEKDTLAAIGNGASVSAQAFGANVTAKTGAQSGSSFSTAALQGVILQANSREELLNVVIAGGAGAYAGVAGSVDVNLITAKTQATIGDNAKINQATGADTDQSVVVVATDSLKTRVYNGALGLSLGGGIAGSVDVTLVRSNTNGTIGAGAMVAATKDVYVAGSAVRDLYSLSVSAAIGAGALAAAVSVYSLYATVDGESKNSLNGDSGSNAATYADDSSDTSVFTDGLNAYSAGDSESSRQMAAANSGAASRISSKTSTGAAQAAINASVTPSGTTAIVGNSAKIVAGGKINVQALDRIDLDVVTGGAAGGLLGGIGASVTIASVGGQSLVSVGDSVTLMADSVTLNANLTSDSSVRAYGGGAGGFVGIGAQVAIINDSHREEARIGNSATVDAASGVTITATGNRTVAANNAGGAIGLVAVGASIARVKATGSTLTSIGSNGKVNTGNSGVTVSAKSQMNTVATAYAVGAGAAAVIVTIADVDVSTNTHSTIGTGTQVNSTGTVTVSATMSASNTVRALGAAVGLVGVGAIDIDYADTSSTSAGLNQVGAWKVGGLNVTASADNSVDMKAVSASGGLLSGSGAGITVAASPTVSTSVSATGTIQVTGNTLIQSRAGSNLNAVTTGVSIGGVTVGVSIVTMRWNPTVTTALAADTRLVGTGDVIIRSLVNYDANGNAQTGNRLFADVTSINGALAGINGAIVDFKSKVMVSATIGGGSTVQADRNFVLKADARTQHDLRVSGLNIGVLTAGIVEADVEVFSDVRAEVQDGTASTPTNIGGGNSLLVNARASHNGNAQATGGGGGLVAVAGADVDYAVKGSGTDNASMIVARVGKDALVFSSGTATIQTDANANFDLRNSQTNGGLFASNETNARSHVRYDALAEIGANTRVGTRNLVVRTNQDISNKVQTYASAGGAVADVETDSNTQVWYKPTVRIGSNATIIATGAVTIENAGGSVYAKSDSYAGAIAAGASVYAIADTTRDIRSTVDVATGEIISPTILIQSLRASSERVATADSSNVSVVGFFQWLFDIDTDEENLRGTISNSVNLNANLTIGTPQRPRLQVAADGQITGQIWATASLQPDRIILDDVFNIPGERLDVRAPDGTTSGSSVVSYGALKEVLIENASDRILVINNIETVSDKPNNPSINHEGSTRNWSYTKSADFGATGEDTLVTIRNTSTTPVDVILAGRIDNPFGKVSITNNGGNVYSSSAGGYINTRLVELNVTAGEAGTVTNPLYIRFGEQKNTALPTGFSSVYGEKGAHLDVSSTSPTSTNFTYTIGNITTNTGEAKIIANEGSKATRIVTTQVRLSDGTAVLGTILPALSFDRKSVASFNPATDQITLNYEHQLKTGESVQYQPLISPSINGVQAWSSRQVRVIDAKTIEFSSDFSTDSVSQTRSTITFATPHGFRTGDAVVYDAEGTTPIPGLTAGATYYVWVFDDYTVQLATSRSTVVAPDLQFRASGVQTINNPIYDAKAKSGLATLKTLDVLSFSSDNPYVTGTALSYWTTDSNIITGLDNLSMYYAIEVPNPDDDAAYNGMIMLASSYANAINGVPLAVSQPANVTPTLHHLRPTNLRFTGAAVAGKTQSLRADLTDASGFSPIDLNLHLIDTNSTYVRDFDGKVIRIANPDIRSIREVISETLSVPSGTVTNVQFGDISSKNGDVNIDIGTSDTFDTTGTIIGTIGAVNGTVNITNVGGSLLNGGTATNIVAKIADLTTWNSVGESTKAITGKIGTLTAEVGTSGSTGGLWLDNTGALLVQDVLGIDQIRITTVDQSGTGDDLTVSPDYVVESTKADVTLRAGDNLYVPWNATVQSPTAIHVYGNFGNQDNVGGRMDVRGKFFSPSNNVYGNAATNDTVVDNNDMNFEIGDTYLRRYINRTLETKFNLFQVTGDHFELTGDKLDNKFTVTDWTGTGKIDGATGYNTVIATNNVDFVLTDATLSRSPGHGIIDLFQNTVKYAILTGGAGDNRFTVTNWTYAAYLDGAAGAGDTVIDNNNVDYTLDDTYLERSTVGFFGLANMERAELTAGASDNIFEVSGWTGIGILDGMGGFNKLMSIRDGDYRLEDTFMQRKIDNVVAGTFQLSNFQQATLLGGRSDNLFDVSGWTGSSYLDGRQQQNTVISREDADATLAEDSLWRGTGGVFLLNQIQTAVISGGKSSNQIDIQGWKGNATVDGGGGGDRLAVVDDTDFRVSPTVLTRGNGTVINVFNVIQVALIGGKNDNLYTFEGTPEFYTIIHAGEGDDVARFVDDANYTITSSNVAVNGLDRFLMTGVDAVNLIGGKSNNQFTVDGWTKALTIDGGLGQNSVIVAANPSIFGLTDGSIHLDQQLINLLRVTDATLIAGNKDTLFDLTGWTGRAHLVGGLGRDTIRVLFWEDAFLSDTQLTLTNQSIITLAGIEGAVLIGSPVGDHTFRVQNFTGTATLTGGSGMNRLIASGGGSFELRPGFLTMGNGGRLNLLGIDETTLFGDATMDNLFTLSGNLGNVQLFGGSGRDEIQIVADTDFTLRDNELLLADGSVVTLTDIEHARLVGGTGDNRFDVSGWTGSATIVGGGGYDSLVSTNNTDFELHSNTLARGDGATFTLLDIDRVALTGGNAVNRFDIADWHGDAVLNGGGNDDLYTVAFAGFGVSSIAIEDSGSSDGDRLVVTAPSLPTQTSTRIFLDEEEILFHGIEVVDLVP